MIDQNGTTELSEDLTSEEARRKRGKYISDMDRFVPDNQRQLSRHRRL